MIMLTYPRKRRNLAMQGRILRSFIVLEGLDGAGTTTQLHALARYYEFNKRRYAITNEPTSNPIGELVRKVLQKKVQTTPEALALLYAADRDDHLHNSAYGIIRMLEEGAVVISDRYLYSSIAYQGVECDLDFIKGINRFPAPEVIIYVDTPVEECLRRIEKRGGEKELFDRAEFLSAVRKNYEAAFAELPEGVNLIRVDGMASPENVEKEIRRALSALSL